MSLFDILVDFWEGVFWFSLEILDKEVMREDMVFIVVI